MQVYIPENLKLFTTSHWINGKCQKSFSILVAIAILFSIYSSVNERALAQPNLGIAIRTKNSKGCVDDRELKKGPLEFYIIHDPENTSSNSLAAIRIRENPSTKSAVVHVASPGNPVIIYQQVVIDNYCWLKVDVTSLSNNDPTSNSTITVRGWVRGDFVTQDKSP